eukprot:2317112-Amphidinium_carterae.4
MELYKAKKLMQKVWRTGRQPPIKVTTRDLGVDTQWAAWRCPVQRKRVMTRVRSLGLPATIKARIVKSLYNVGLYGAEVGGMSVAHINDVRVSARKALGKGANLRRSSPLELMAYGGPAGDPQKPALNKGRGRRPIRDLKTLANRVGWVPHPQGRQCGEQIFTWQDANWKIKRDSSRALLADVTSKRPDFA